MLLYFMWNTAQWAQHSGQFSVYGLWFCGQISRLFLRAWFCFGSVPLIDVSIFSHVVYWSLGVISVLRLYCRIIFRCYSILISSETRFSIQTNIISIVCFYVWTLPLRCHKKKLFNLHIWSKMNGKITDNIWL